MFCIVEPAAISKRQDSLLVFRLKVYQLMCLGIPGLVNGLRDLLELVQTGSVLRRLNRHL